MHKCGCLVISCIDFRIVKLIRKWLQKNLAEGSYDEVMLAGGGYDFYTILKQVEISRKLHAIKKVILINHEDCGAYGKEGNFAKHKKDLGEAERKLEVLFPELDTETYYLKLNGDFINLSRTNRVKRSGN